MATEFTPEEIQRIFAEYNEAIKTGSPITKDLADRMRDASKGMKDYTKNMEEASRKLGRSMVDLTKTMYQGKQGMEAMNSAVDAVGSAVNLLINILPVGRLLKVGLTLLNSAIGGAVKTINQQSDQLFKSYQDLSKVGASAAGGMTDVFQNMQKFGYGLAELESMTQLIKENSSALASFGGTVASGTRAFADTATMIQHGPLGKSLQMLGQTPDDINRGVAMFVKQQQQSGMTNSQINQNLAQRSAEYIKNLDLLSKLTGEDAARLQAKLDDAMAEDAFNQTIYELKKKQAAGDQEAGRLAVEYENAARRLTGEALKEFQRGVGGDLSAMQKTMMTSSEAVGMIGSKAFTASGYIDAMAKGAVQSREAFGGLAKFNATQDFLLPMRELGLAESRYAEQTAKQQEDRARAEQELQQKGLDPATKAQVELRLEQMKVRDSMQSLVNVGVKPVTEAMSGLSKVIRGTTGLLTGKGVEGGGGAGPMGGTAGTAPTPAAPAGAPSGTAPTSAAPAGGVDAILATIRKRESGNNYAAQAKGSTASGAYQFIDSTWQALTKKTGIGTEYKSAKMAPAEIQDAVARAYVQDILGRAGGDVSKVPLEWYTGNIQGKISAKALAANQGLTPEMYQQKWLADYGKMGGTTGPASGYKFGLAAADASTSLPTRDASTTGSASPIEQSESLLAMFADKLDQLNRRMGDVADNTKKTAQYAAA